MHDVRQPALDLRVADHGRMSILNSLYRPSLALLTDLYELTMAYGYWKAGPSDREAVFHLTFRRSPFHGGYTIAAGLATAIDYLENSRFTDADAAYLATLTGQRRPAAVRAGAFSISSARSSRPATSTPCRKARWSFPRNRWCGSAGRCCKPSCWKPRC